MTWNSKKYARIHWKNRPSTATALGATNLNRMDVFLNEVDNALIEFEAKKLNISTANSMIASLTIDTDSWIIVATQLDGTAYTWDLNLEKIPVSFSLSEDGVLTMTTDDGTQWTANIAELIKDYVFDDSDTVGFTKTFSNNEYHVTAIVKDGSIEGRHLNPDYRAHIQSYKNDAQESASESEQYAKDAKRWAVGDIAYAGSDSDNSKFYYMQSKSYAVGTGNEAREGDVEDNSKYYYQQSKGIFDGLSAGQVTGVKGSEESTYRKGDVNLTPENIGAIATDGDASLTTVNFEESETREPIQSGSTLGNLFGKIKKWFSSLGSAAFVETENIVLQAHPVGSIYMSANSTSPGSLFGGTWVAWGQGRVPIGVSETDADFNGAGKTGGAKTISIANKNLPAQVFTLYNAPSGTSGNYSDVKTNTVMSGYVATQVSTRTGGESNQPIDIIPPYITCYMWKRTA